MLIIELFIVFMKPDFVKLKVHVQQVKAVALEVGK